MKKVALYSLMALTLFALAQCKNSKKVVKEEVHVEEWKEERVDPGNDMPLRMEEEPPMPQASEPKVLLPVKVYANYIMDKNDPYTLLGTRISGDTLFANVQYGGGCEEHTFTMNTTGAWMKSMPPQLHIYLEHRANNDRCRALITKEIAIDLSKTRYPGAKEVRLILNDNREQYIVYKY